MTDQLANVGEGLVASQVSPLSQTASPPDVSMKPGHAILPEPVAAAVRKRVAELLAFDVSKADIAAATAHDLAAIEAIAAEPETKQAVAVLMGDRLDQFRTLDAAWDCAEDLALRTVLVALQANPDPRLALQVATMANRAERRGSKATREPIDGSGEARTVVLSLSQTFVDKLANTTVNMAAPVTASDELREPTKNVDVMNPAAVRVLLDAKSAPATVENIGQKLAQLGMGIVSGATTARDSELDAVPA